MKKLLIVTGPQGSGNHLFSKIFAQTPDVFGWRELNNEYWIPHEREPFARAWHNPFLLKTIHFHDYAVTGISCPYAYNGETVEPDYKQFINTAREIGYEVKVAVIGRDQNILRHQQERVRGTYSFNRFVPHMSYLSSLDPVFLSTELLYMYRMNYVRSLPALLGMPVSITEEKLEEILVQDPNSKYFTAAEEQPLDNYVRKVSGLNIV